MTETDPSDRAQTVAGELEPADDATRRRTFLCRFGRFAAVTPPAIAVILAAEFVPTAALASGVGPPFEAPPEEVPPPVAGRRTRGGS